MRRNNGGSESSGCQVSDSIYPGPVYLTTKEIVSPQCMLGLLQQVKLAALADLLFLGGASLPGWLSRLSRAIQCLWKHCFKDSQVHT